MDQGLNRKIDAYIAENKEQLLQDIAALVAIDSVEGTPEEGAPFGKGPRAALDKTLELAAASKPACLSPFPPTRSAWCAAPA